MKKILFLTFIIIVIPYILISILTTEHEIKFDYKESIIVRVKRKDTIENIYLEDYITGVLAGELPISFNKEAFKAQAVAARSYVLKKIEYNKNNEFDVYDSTKDQVYLDTNYLKSIWKKDYIKKINKIKKVVIETSGEYIK